MDMEYDIHDLRDVLECYSMSEARMMIGHPWAWDLYDVVDYMHKVGIREDLVIRYVRCAMIVDWIAHYVDEVPTEDIPITLILFKMFDGQFANLNETDILNGMKKCAECMTCAGEHVYFFGSPRNMNKFKPIWNIIHKCGDDVKEKCGCEWLLNEAIKCIEDILVYEHNNAIGGFGLLWEANYENADCMTTWIPREIMEDVVEMYGGSHPSTRLVRV